MPPTRVKTAGLQHPQQFDLQLHRHFRHFVKEDAAAVGALKETLMLTVRSGKTAALVTEELGLNELWRDGAAVQGQKRRIAAPAEFMHRVRSELLARAALTDQ